MSTSLRENTLSEDGVILDNPGDLTNSIYYFFFEWYVDYMIAPLMINKTE